MENVKEVTEDVDGVTVIRKKPMDVDSFAFKDNTGTDLYALEQNRQNVSIPIKEKVNLNQDRTLGVKRGPYQIALKAERSALMQDMRDLLGSINAAKTTIAPDVTRDDVDNLRYIPNARFAYYNRLLRDAIANRKTSNEDIKYVDTVWMNDDAKESVRRILRLFLDPKINTFTVRPTPSRSAMSYYDDPKDQRLALKLANPGTLYFPTTFLTSNDNDQTKVKNMMLEETLTRTVTDLNEQMSHLIDQMHFNEDTEDFYTLKGNSRYNEMTKALIYLRDKLLDRHLSYKDIIEITDALNRMMGAKQSKYLMSLSNPFKHKTARIPTLISPPSATFSLRTVVPLTTNASGNVAFAFNPCYLNGALGTSTTFTVNNSVTLTGLAPDNNFVGVDAGQNLPADFYVRYRPVSAGLRLYCYPSSNNDNGIAVVSVTMESVSSGLIGVANAQLQQFGAFNQIENGYYKQTTTVASREVQEHVYVPLDESFWDYVVLGATKIGFAWIGYITGGIPSSTLARAEVITNYEAILDNQYTDYLPSESPMEDLEPKMIFNVLNKLKKEQVQLSPKKIQQVLSEDNLAITPDTTIDLPKSTREQKQDTFSLKTIGGALKSVVEDVLPSLPGQQQQSWLAKIMDVVSPVASQIIQAAAKIYSPSLPSFMSLGKGF